MMSDVEITHAAHLLVDKYGGNAELEAARYADIMSGRSDRDGLLIWSKSGGRSPSCARYEQTYRNEARKRRGDVHLTDALILFKRLGVDVRSIIG